MFTIPPIPQHKEIINKAFEKARLSSETVKAKNQYVRKKVQALKSIEVATANVQSQLDKVLDNTSYINKLPIFYQELLSLLIDVRQFKKSMAALKWAHQFSGEMMNKYKQRIRTSKQERFLPLKLEYYGRLSSIVKQIKDDLLFLEKTRAQIKNLPAFKQMFTVVIAGMPNVGKSMLLKSLTGSKVKIENYPFTTKSLNVGHIEDFMQLIDTPGLLDRPLHKRNKVELQAILALKHIGNEILFIFDLSETGYSLKEQLSLYNEIKSKFNLPFITCINKIDDTPKERIVELRKQLKQEVFEVSALNNTNIDELRKLLMKHYYKSVRQLAYSK